jgi:hypothetical protein
MGCSWRSPKRTSPFAPKTLKTGTKVKWKSHGGKARGKVVKKQTSPTTIKGHKVAASPDKPEYIVETAEGKNAAHKAGALRRISCLLRSTLHYLSVFTGC